MQPAAAATRRARRPLRLPAGQPALRGPQRAAALNVLVAEQGNVECANTPDGVKLTVTTDQPRLVARLQEQANNRVDRLDQTAAAAASAPPGRKG